MSRFSSHLMGREWISGMYAIHARNPFMTRIHVLSNPSSTVVLEGDDKPLTVLKEERNDGRDGDKAALRV
jgi:hypothetical protein